MATQATICQHLIAHTSPRQHGAAWASTHHYPLLTDTQLIPNPDLSMHQPVLVWFPHCLKCVNPHTSVCNTRAHTSGWFHRQSWHTNTHMHPGHTTSFQAICKHTPTSTHHITRRLRKRCWGLPRELASCFQRGQELLTECSGQACPSSQLPQQSHPVPQTLHPLCVQY